MIANDHDILSSKSWKMFYNKVVIEILHKEGFDDWVSKKIIAL